jgi:hypothetical protein
MTNGKLEIVDSFEADTEECSWCSKTKEGIVLKDEEGRETNWCWPCMRKFMKMRRAAARPKSEPETATFPAMRTGS